MKTSKHIHSTNVLLSLFVTVALVCLPGCKKESADTSESAEPTAPTTTTSATVRSAEKTSFHEVAAHLDPGGSLYGYLGTRQWLEGMSGKVEEWREVIAELPQDNPEDQLKVNQAFDLITNLIRNSGIEGISGVGVSGIALEPGYYQTKMMVHRYPDAKPGYLWSMFGEAPHSLDELNLLPAETVWASFGDLDPVILWSAIKREVENAGLTEAVEGLAKLDAMIEQATGSNLSALLGSLGGRQGLLITLDESRTIQFPLPDGGGTIQIPEPALLIAIKVKDDALFNLIDARLKEMPQVVSSNANGLRARTMTVPLPIPINLKPTVARYEDYLFIGSSDEIVQKIVAVQSGERPGLKTTAEFQRLAKGMPAEGNQFSFVSERLSRTVQEVQARLMNMAAESEGDQAPVGLLRKLYGSGRLVSSYNVGANTDEGWLMIGHGNQEPASMAAVPLFIVPVGLVAAIAVPNFVQARDTAQSNACRNNLKQIGLASLMWADSHDATFPGDFLSMKDELPGPSVLVCPKDSAAPKSKSLTWEQLDVDQISYEFVAPGLKLRESNTLDEVLVRCPVHGHELMGDGRVESGD